MVALGFGFGVGVVVSERLLPPTRASAAPRPVASRDDHVHCRGRLEPANGVVTVSLFAPDQVVEVLAKEGASVDKHDSLVVLASQDSRELAVSQAKADLDDADQRIAAIRRNVVAQDRFQTLQEQQSAAKSELAIREQQAKVDMAEAQLKIARNNEERLKKVSDNTVSNKEREQQRLLVTLAEGELAIARSELDSLQQQKRLDPDVIKAKSETSRAALERALREIPRAALALRLAQAKLELARSQVRSPIKGRVLEVLVHPGDVVGAQPVVRLADPSRMVVDAELPEDDLDRVTIGQRAVVTSGVFRAGRTEPLAGTVVGIGASITKSRLVGDGRVRAVTIALDDTSNPRAARYIGHEVSVAIDSQSKPKP